MKVKYKSKRKPRVEMLPLIDIVFLLLIFFIYAMLSMAVHQGLDLNLPKSSTVQSTKEEALAISVKHHGTKGDVLLVMINDMPIDLADLGAELKATAQNNKRQHALIFAEETISYQELFQVLDQIKNGGIEQISLQANKSEE